MTTSSVTPRVKYNGSASTGPFSIPFYWLDTSELVVTKTSSTGVESTLAVTSNYTATGAGTDTGSLTLVTSLAVGETLVIERVTTKTQGLDVQRSYLDLELIEAALDKGIRHAQDLWYQVGRTLRLYKDDTTGSGAFDASGNKISNVAAGTASTDVATKGQLDTIAGSATAAAASATAAASSAATAQNLADQIGSAIAGSVLSFEGRTGVVTSQAGDYTASEITNVPSGNLAATTVQAALNELQSDIDGRQSLDAELTALAGLTSAANKLPYFTGSGTAATTDFTSFARSILSGTDAAGVRTTLGLSLGADVQAFSSALKTVADNITSFGQSLIDDASASAARTTLGLGSAATSDTSAFQAADATLSSLASYNTNGILTQTAADTFVGRTVTGGTGISVTNGNGVSGNPTIAVDISGLTNRSSFGSGDKLMIYEDGVGIRKIDYDDLPSGGSGGGGLSNAYKDVTDGSVTASASGADALKFRGGTGLSVTVGSNDPTHGDNVLYELDATLSALAGISTAADQLPYLTGTDTWSTTTVTSFARGLLDDADASAMRTTLEVRPGVDVQTYSAGLADISGLAKTDGNIIVGDGANWVAESGATARASLGLTIGTDVQAYDAELAALASTTSAADKVPYFTGSGTASTATLTSFARTLIDDADQATARSTLGVGTADNPQFNSIELGNASDTTISRSSAGVIAVEGVTVPLNSTSSTHTASTIELGHATDTTISRVSAGQIAVEGKHVPCPASQAQGDILYHNGTTWARLAAGTNGHYLKTQGAGANPAWAAVSASGGMTLLGTLTTTSGASQSLGSLTLTGYKMLILVFQGCGGGSGGSFLLGTSTSDDVSISITASTGTSAYNGHVFVDLSAGYGFAFLSSGTSAQVGNGFASPITTASTAVSVARAAGNFNAGSIRIYGVA